MVNTDINGLWKKNTLRNSQPIFVWPFLFLFWGVAEACKKITQRVEYCEGKGRSQMIFDSFDRPKKVSRMIKQSFF